MTSLLAFAYLLSGAVMVLAWVVAHREPAHRPIAALFTAALGSDLARRALRVLVLAPARARGGGEPFTGIARAACDLDNALFLSWPASLAAVSLWIFARRRPWPALAAWGASVLALGLLYAAIARLSHPLQGLEFGEEGIRHHPSEFRACSRATKVYQAYLGGGADSTQARGTPMRRSRGGRRGRAGARSRARATWLALTTCDTIA